MSLILFMNVSIDEELHVDIIQHDREEPGQDTVCIISFPYTLCLLYVHITFIKYKL